MCIRDSFNQRNEVVLISSSVFVMKITSLIFLRIYSLQIYPLLLEFESRSTFKASDMGDLSDSSFRIFSG